MATSKREMRAVQGEPAPRALHASTRFVRVTSSARDGYVEFQFSIGDPTLALDMILPRSAFAEFCAAQKAVLLDGHEGEDRSARNGDAATNAQHRD